jgi:hypothetical protein
MKITRQVDSVYSKIKLHNQEIYNQIKDIELKLSKIKLAKDKYGLLMHKHFLTGQFRYK